MWQKYKSAFITGAVLCCIIFFGLGYCVGSSGKGYHGGIQPTEFQGAKNGNNRVGPGGRHHGYRPDVNTPQNPTENGDQSTEENQQTPDSNSENQTTPGTDGGTQTAPGNNGAIQALPDNNDNTGSQDGTANPTSYL